MNDGRDESPDLIDRLKAADPAAGELADRIRGLRGYS
jgi:hypothetical protein